MANVIVQRMHCLVEESVHSWSPELQRAFWPYWTALRTAHEGGKRSSGENETGKYWLVLPSWLERRYSREPPDATGGVSTFLQDVLWGQYALFAAVRIQDDLFDGQAQWPALIFASDQFLLEAEGSFRRACGDHPAFWPIYRECLETTLQAIVETDVLLQGESTSPEVLLEKYAAVSSVFKLGSAAVCLRRDRFDDFTFVGRFCDEMARVSQIFDDLEDVVDDLTRGRSNFVARILGINLPRPGNGEKMAEIVAEQLVGERKSDRVLAEARKHLDRAEDAVRPIALPESGPYLASQKEILGDLERVFKDRSRKELAGCLFQSGGLDSLLRSSPTPVWRG